MPVLRIETSQLLLYDPDKSQIAVHCFVAQPTPLEERMLGRLFMVFEIGAQDGGQHQIIDSLQREMQGQYYQSEDFQAEVAFERALQKLNERLPYLVPQNLEAWVQKANILIGVLKDSSLHFTIVGRMHAFLVHRQRIVDILETSRGATEAVSPLKIFTNIISGHVSIQDSLLFCTTSVLDYLSQEKLKRLIADQRPNEAVRGLEKLLAESDGTAAFGAVVLQLRTTENAAETSTPVVQRDTTRVLQPQISMEELIRREQKTNELLTHPLWPNIGRLAQGGTRYIGDALRGLMQPRSAGKTEVSSLKPEEEFSPPHAAPPATRSTVSGAALGKGVLSILIGLGKGILFLVQAVFSLVRFLSPRSRGKPRTFSSGTNRRIAHGASWFQHLTAARRRLLLVAVVLILLFAQSVVSLGASREKKQKQESYQALLTTVRERLSAAEAALLIKNESGARRSLQEATDALRQIPDDAKSLRSEKQSLQSAVNGKLETIRHVLALQPELVYDLAGLDVGFTPLSLHLSGTTLYTFNTQTASVYAIGTDTKEADVVVDAPSLERPLQYFVPGSNALMVLQTGGSLQQVNIADKSLATVPAVYPQPDPDVQDAVFYNNRLYTLDIRNNQIFRHERSGNGYAAGKPWMTETGVDVRSARSFVIDGSIYLLSANGALTKFSAGKRDTVTFDAVDPQLSDPKIIAALPDATNLFVLDPPNKRIVEFAKTGAFIQQYVADVLSDAKDLVLNKSTLYVLSGTQIFSIPITAAAE